MTPFLPPYLLQGGSQKYTPQVPYRAEPDHKVPSSKSSSTAKRKLTVFDLDIHMRYTQSASITIEDVIGATLSLLESMIRQGLDCTGMVKHVRFLVEKSKVYSSQSLIGYDLEMRERAEVFGASVFCYGDHELTHRWLGVDALRQSTVASVSTKKSLKPVKKSFGLCWNWNDGRACKQIPCKYKHVCSQCQGDHKSSECTSRSGSTTASLPKNQNK